MSTEHETEQPPQPWVGAMWVGFVVAALMALDVFGPIVYGVVVPAAAAGLCLAVWRRGAQSSRRAAADRQDLVAIGALYVVVVALFGVAFEGFGTDRVAGLFLAFAAGLVLGVGGALLYTVWHRERSLASLGLTTARWPVTVGLGVLFAGVQFVLTLWATTCRLRPSLGPVAGDVAGGRPFEAVFFRGFIQGRLEASFGTVPAVAGARAVRPLPRRLRHGRGRDGVLVRARCRVRHCVPARRERARALAVAHTARRALRQPRSGDIELPWASIAGFVDVAVVMAVLVWLAHRHQRRRHDEPTGGPRATEVAHMRPGHLSSRNS